MQKMLFTIETGNLFEVLQNGGGPYGRSYIVEIWNNKKNKWNRTPIEFVVQSEKRIESEVISIAKEKVKEIFV